MISDPAPNSVSAPAVVFDGDLLRVRFDARQFCAGAGYELFKKIKRLPEYSVEVDDEGLACGIAAPARFANMLGVEVQARSNARIPMGEFLHDDQVAEVEMGLAGKRFAVWSDCGLGKTFVEYEWARQVSAITADENGGGRVLILTLNGVIDQFIEMIAAKYPNDPPIVRLETREQMKSWCATCILLPEDNSHVPGGDGRNSDHDNGRGRYLRVDRTPVGSPDSSRACADGPRDGASDSRQISRSGPDGINAYPVHGNPHNPDHAGRIWQSDVDYRSQPRGLIAITNYEKFNHKTESEQVVSELRCLAGFCLDESSRLKAGGGKQKWAIIKSARGIEYKLSATATPAPNELMEFASQASFLEKLRATSIADAADQIMWTYFTRDSKTHRWTIKQHARAAFFEWMSSWSIYVRDPRKYGWRLTGPNGPWTPPPEPTYFQHDIAMTPAQREFVMDFNSKAPPAAGDESGTIPMFVGQVNATTSSKLSQAAKGFVYVKKVAGDRLPVASKGKPLHGASTEISSSADAGNRRKLCSREKSADRKSNPSQSLSPTEGQTAAGSAGIPEIPAGILQSIDIHHQLRRNEIYRSDENSQTTNSSRVRLIPSLKPARVADLIRQEIKLGLQVLVWTEFDAEVDILCEELERGGKVDVPDFAFDVLTGSVKKADREPIIRKFREGETRLLITRTDLFGFGQNVQHCGSMIFNAWTFSYEDLYQAIRRAVRDGQTRSVRIHFPMIAELEGQMFDALARKQTQHEQAIAEMEKCYIAARTVTAGTPALLIEKGAAA